jgi:hypothetical protein
MSTSIFIYNNLFLEMICSGWYNWRSVVDLTLSQTVDSKDQQKQREEHAFQLQSRLKKCYKESSPPKQSSSIAFFRRAGFRAWGSRAPSDHTSLNTGLANVKSSNAQSAWDHEGVRSIW